MGLSLSTDTLNIIGIVYSALALALAFFQCFVRKCHSRALDYIQWAYFLSLTSVQFSNYLNVGSSLIALNTDTLNSFYCTLGTYVCNRAFALSFIVILSGVLLIMRFITIPEKVREKGVTFPRVYWMLKGLIKWVYLPLLYLSINYLLSNNGQILASVVILAVLLVFPIVQVILYRCFEKQDDEPILKWLQFANYAKAALFALLFVLVNQYGVTAYYYYLALVLIGYAVFFGIKFPFKFEKTGRVLYILGEVIFYFLYSLFVTNSIWIADYSLDLFGLGIIIVLDIVYLIMQAKQIHKQWKSTRSQIVPEQSVNQQKNKKNSYEIELDDNQFKKNGSRQDLTNEYDLGTYNSNSLKRLKNQRRRPGK